MNNQNVIKEKKRSRAPAIAKIAFILSLVGGLAYVFMEFVWPIIITPVSLAVGMLLGVFCYVPVIGWIIVPLILSVLLIFEFILYWGVSMTLTIATIAGMTLGITSLLTFVKNTGKGKGLSVAAIIISGLVLLTSFCISFFDLVLSILSIFVIFGLLIFLFVFLLIIGL